MFYKKLKKYIKEEYYNLKNNHSLKLITIIILIILYPITIPVAIISFIIGAILVPISEFKKYNNSTYKVITKKTYLDVILNKGNIAEYYIWKILDKQPEYKKVLINLYIPNKEKTTEIDSILINQYGIFVIESKGYSGWIFGNENDKNWTQVIYNYKKRFYNPIIQNRNHIKNLSNILEVEDMDIFRSYIVFSNRCELKNISATKANLKVINIENLQNTLDQDYKKYGKVLTNEQVRILNDKLFSYMFTDEEVKREHIEFVRKIIDKNK